MWKNIFLWNQIIHSPTNVMGHPLVQINKYQAGIYFLAYSHESRNNGDRRIPQIGQEIWNTNS